MDNCIFCKIITGEIPSTKIYEDDNLVAFLDITQTTKGHTLVVPKTHTRNLLAMEPEQASQLFSRIPEIANKLVDSLDAKGMNILQNNEEIAGQTVFPTHVHLIPRYAEDDGFSAAFNDVSEIFSRLSKEIDEVKANLENVKIEAKKAELTGQEIQRKVNEFQTLAQPKVDKINEILEKLSEKSSEG